MQQSFISAVLFAIGAGAAIAVQSTIVNANGQAIGAIRTAFGVHFAGAIVGIVILLLLQLRSNDTMPTLTMPLVASFLLAGGLGMFVLPSIAVSFPRIGLVAGQVAIIMGQISVSVLIDTFGLTGSEPIPLDWQRILGIVLMGVAVYLLLPKQ